MLRQQAELLKLLEINGEAEFCLLPMEDPTLEQGTTPRGPKEAVTLRETRAGVVHHWENHSLWKEAMPAVEVCGRLPPVGGMSCCCKGGL